MIPPIGAQVKPLGIVSDRPRHAIAGFAPLVSQFPSARWVVDSPENALVDSPDPASSEHQLLFVSPIERVAELTARSS